MSGVELLDKLFDLPCVARGGLGRLELVFANCCIFLAEGANAVQQFSLRVSTFLAGRLGFQFSEHNGRIVPGSDHDPFAKFVADGISVDEFVVLCTGRLRALAH